MTFSREQLHSYIAKAQNFAEWIYHDVRLDCDQGAGTRTMERVTVIDEQYGKEALFGLCGWWAVSAYWRLEDAHRVRGLPSGPDLLPKNVEAAMQNENETLEKRRAYVSAQQFISTLTHDDVEMAWAIFSAAYDAGREDCAALLYSVLYLSIRISNVAIKVKRRG